MNELVEDVAGMLRALAGSFAHVACHDWRAAVAWCFASIHSDMTKTLTVPSVGHPAALADATAHDKDQQERSRYVALFLSEGKAESVLSEEDHRRLRAMLGSAIPSGVVDHFVRSLSRPGRLTAGLNYYRANLARDRAWTDLRRDVSVTAPTVLLWGDQDPALGRLQAEDTARHMRGEYRLEVLEGAGHWLQVERPDEGSRP